MPVADLVKEIKEKKLKAVQDRLKKEKPDQKYSPSAGVNIYPLHAAVEAGAPALVDAMLAASASVAVLDSNEETPLHWAARHDTKESVQIAGEGPRTGTEPHKVPASLLTPPVRMCECNTVTPASWRSLHHPPGVHRLPSL